MNHSTWDLEVHAREMQRRRFREADRARQIDAARLRGDQMRVSPIRFSISRFMTAFRNCLSPQRSAIDGAAGPAVGETRVMPLPALDPRPNPDALAQPYAGMMVLARGTTAQTTAQPCAAGDC